MKTIESTIREVELITDRLGMSIDKEIRSAVVVFRFAGLFTSGSCQGHLHRALPYPWIGFNDDSQEENKKSRLWIETALNNYPNNEYLYIWNQGIYSGFRLHTLDASSIQHLILLREEMNSFAKYFLNKEHKDVLFP